MRLSLILLAIAFLYSCPRSALAQTQPSDSTTPTKSKSRSLPVEMRVPFEPTVFPSGPHSYAIYELHLTNFGAAPVTLSSIEVLDPDAQNTRPVATFDSEQLEAMVQPLGGRTLSDRKERLVMTGGQSAIVFMSIEFERDSRVPKRLSHRVSMADSYVEGVVITTDHTRLRVLGPPVEGAGWLAADGPGNDEDNHHRRGVLVFDGEAVDSRRFAIDWKQVKNNASFSGDTKDVHSYYAYGKTVVAVADARVITARDGLPDNIPGHFEAFHPAVAITYNTVAGNTITLDLGGGQFAYYDHLQPGSLRVRSGDHVRRGQPLARVGCSGDAREPHLHFEVTTSPKLLAGEGLPYVIDRYRSQSADGHIELHLRELPLNKSIIIFGEDRSK